MTAENLAPAPANPREVDWVYVGRLLGLLPGPITRRPTPAEARAAVRGDNALTVNQLAHRLDVSHTSAALMVGEQR